MVVQARQLMICCLAGLLTVGMAGNVLAHDTPVKAQEGVASFYSDHFQGKTTASGEPFDQQELTAAHPTLPFGTKVLVVREDTGSKVEVVINDRGPYAKGRIIDLSKRAAKKLGMLKRGTAPVMVTSLQ
jgi:rare lipoprotein A